MALAGYRTEYSVSPNGKCEIFFIIDPEGDRVATAKTAGNGWTIDGLFPATRRKFETSQAAIEQAVFLFEQRKLEWADRELMTLF